MDKLPEFHERMRGVQVVHQDFRNALSRYDCPEMLWYLDPTYVTDPRSGPKLYEHELTEDDHRELVDLLLGAWPRSRLGQQPSALRGVGAPRLAAAGLWCRVPYRRRASRGERLDRSRVRPVPGGRGTGPVGLPPRIVRE